MLCAAREGCIKCTAVFVFGGVCEIQWLLDVHRMCAISQSLQNACVMYEKIGRSGRPTGRRVQTPELHFVRESGGTSPTASSSPLLAAGCDQKSRLPVFCLNTQTLKNTKMQVSTLFGVGITAVPENRVGGHATAQSVSRRPLSAWGRV